MFYQLSHLADDINVHFCSVSKSYLVLGICIKHSTGSSEKPPRCTLKSLSAQRP